MKRKRMTLLAVALALTFSVAACANKQTHPPHPNQLNTFDGDSYDALNVAQGVLNEAKVQYAAGKLPAAAKAIINETGKAYDTARVAWEGYRDILMGLKTGDPEQAKAKLQTDLGQMNSGVAQLKTLTGGK